MLKLNPKLKLICIEKVSLNGTDYPKIKKGDILEIKGFYQISYIKGAYDYKLSNLTQERTYIIPKLYLEAHLLNFLEPINHIKNYYM